MSKLSQNYGIVKAILNNEWPTIRVILGFATFITVLVAAIQLVFTAQQTTSVTRQTSLLATQLAYEVSTPILEGDASFFPGIYPDILSVETEMVNEWFASLNELAKNNTDKSYAELIKQVPPITRNIPAAPTTIEVTLTNTGQVSAFNVTVAIRWSGKITVIEVQALSKWEIVSGGQEQDEVTLIIERISKAETIQISANYAPAENETDVIELSAEHTQGGFFSLHLTCLVS